MNRRKRIIPALLIALLLVMPLLPLSPTQVLADSTGAKYPGTKTTQAVAPEDDVNWSNPANIGASDNAYATASFTIVDQISYRLKAQGFDFSVIPDGATIDGILVEIEKKRSPAYSPPSIRDYRVQLLDASGSLIGDNKAKTIIPWLGVDDISSYGGASDAWGASPTSAMVKDADFGVILSAKCFGLGSSPPAIAYVDCIRITIYYTVAAESYFYCYILG